MQQQFITINEETIIRGLAVLKEGGGTWEHRQPSSSRYSVTTLVIRGEIEESHQSWQCSDA